MRLLDKLGVVLHGIGFGNCGYGFNVTNASLLDELTPRQLEILTLVAKGLTNNDVSKALGISHNTVKVHLTAVTATLGVANRTEAASLYQQCQTQQGYSPSLDVVHRIGRPALAVLQLRQLTESGTIDPAAEHLADGLTQDLITRLASWRWFPIIAYASSKQIDGGEVDIALAGRNLGAKYIVTGSLRRDQHKARLNVNLWETDASILIWADAIEFELQLTLAMQDKIAKQIVSHIAPELLTHAGTTSQMADVPNFDLW